MKKKPDILYNQFILNSTECNIMFIHMNGELKAFLEHNGIQDVEFLENRNTYIEIDSTGKQDPIESIANELGLSLDEGEDQFFSAIEIISVAGSLITIIDFLLKMKRLYGPSLIVRAKSLAGRNIEMTIDDCLKKIVKDVKNNV